MTLAFPPILQRARNRHQKDAMRLLILRDLEPSMLHQEGPYSGSEAK